MTIKAFVDYSCPYCYLATKYLEEILPEFPNIKLDFHFCEAHPSDQPRLEIMEKSIWWIRSMKPVAEANGVELNFPITPVPYSNKAIQGHFFLESFGFSSERYNKKIFDSYYKNHENPEDIQVILKAMEGYDIDLKVAEKALEDETFKLQQLEANKFAYVENKVEVIPTFIYKNFRLEAIIREGVTKAEIREFFESVSTLD